MLAIAGGLKDRPEPPGQLANLGAFWVEWMWGILGFVGAGASG